MHTRESRLTNLINRYEALVTRPNPVDEDWYNGVFTRYAYPVLTAEHAPLHWRFDLDPETNPRLIERIGVNAAMNSGAIFLDGKYCLVARMEGVDRKSSFALPYQSLFPLPGNSGSDLQVQMAYRNLLQVDQTEPANQSILWTLRERCEDPDLDRDLHLSHGCLSQEDSRNRAESGKNPPGSERECVYERPCESTTCKLRYKKII